MKRPAHALETTLLVLFPCVVLLHVPGGMLAPSALWGANFYAFFPPWVAAVAVAALAIVCGVLLARGADSRLSRSLDALPDPRAWSPRRQFAVGIAASLAAGGVFWLLRIRHVLLGDGNSVLLGLPRGEDFHPRQPLTVVLTYRLYEVVRAASTGVADDVVAQNAVAIGSVLAGMLFVPVAYGLAVELAALQQPPRVRTKQDDAPATASGATIWLLAAMLLAQGWMQLFFGYVENYTYYLLVLGAYLWLALRYLAGRTRLVVPLLAALLAFVLHLSGGILLLSAAYLAWVGLRRLDRRTHALPDLALVGVATLGLYLALRLLGHGYDLAGYFVQVFREAVMGGGGDALYMWSLPHWRDFFNEQLLIGPLGLLLFLPALVFALRGRRLASPAARFLLIAAVTYLGASWVAGDSNLGYSRNWDLLAPGGLVFIAAGLGLFFGSETRSPRPQLLALGVALSLFHTLPWIAVNASPQRAVARMTLLPLGQGRAQTAVGTWYMRAGDHAQAIEWFRKGLQEDPKNPNAYQMMGFVYVEQGNMPAAADAFVRASVLRPDKPEYHTNAAEALFQAGRFQEALPHYEWLCRTQPEVFHYWQSRVQALAQIGRQADAQRVLEEARGTFTALRERDPAGAASNFNLGLVYVGLQQPSNALACFERALRADPNSEEVLYNTSAMLMNLGRRAEAQPYIERLLRSADPNVREQARALAAGP